MHPHYSSMQQHAAEMAEGEGLYFQQQQHQSRNRSQRQSNYLINQQVN